MFCARTLENLTQFVRAAKPIEAKYVEMYFNEGVVVSISRKKAVSDGNGGCTVASAEPLIISYKPSIDISNPFSAEEARTVRSRVAELNPGLKTRTCDACKKLAAADEVAGNEYVWECSNGYWSSVILKFVRFDAYCATGFGGPPNPQVAPQACESELASDDKSPPEPHWRPAVEEPYIQDARMVTASRKLMTYLKNHPCGDFVQNPYRKLAGPHTLTATQEKSKDHIKHVITQWALNSDDGRKWLETCRLTDGEFTIDRVFSRKGRNRGTNCVWNLYAMSMRANAYFNNHDGPDKAEFVGAKAWAIGQMADDVFHDLAENTFDFEKACAAKARSLALSLP